MGRPRGTAAIIEGAVIRLQVDHLPSGSDPKPVWLWWSRTDASEADVDRCWQAFLRRFDIEHTLRLFKQTLGWTAPSCAIPDRWTWIVIAAHPTPAGPSHTPDPPTTKAPNPGERFDYKLRPPPRDKRDNQEPSRSGEGCHVNQSSAGPQARTESERPHGSDAHPEPR